MSDRPIVSPESGAACAGEDIATVGLWGLDIGPERAASMDEYDRMMNAALGAVQLLIIHALAEGIEPGAVVEGAMRCIGEFAAEVPADEMPGVLKDLMEGFNEGLKTGRADIAAANHDTIGAPEGRA